MAAKKYTNARKREKGGGENEIPGIVLVIISAFILLCIVIPPVMGDISKAIYNVVIGVLGVVSYPLFISTFILGIALIQGRQISLSAKYVLCIAIIALSSVILLQTATSHALLGAKFSAYISGVYHNVTAGGVIFGVIAYGFAGLVTPVLSYVILSCIIVATSAIVIMSVLKNRSSYTVSKNTKQALSPVKTDFIKGTAAKTVQPVADNTLFVEKILPNVNRPQTESGSLETIAPAKTLSQNVSNKENDRKNEKKKPTLLEMIRNEKNSLGEGESGGNFESYSDKNEKTDARKILFGDRDKKMADLNAVGSSYSSGKKYSAEGAYSGVSSTSGSLSGFYPFAAASAPDVRAERPSLSSQSNYAAPIVTPKTHEPTLKKPPKIIDIHEVGLKEIPFLPPKNVENEYVGGTIINGDDLSSQLAESNSKKVIGNDNVKSGEFIDSGVNFGISTSNQSGTVMKSAANNQVNSSSNNSASEQAKQALSEKDRLYSAFNTEYKEPPQIERAPIMNGDYYAQLEREKKLEDEAKKRKEELLKREEEQRIADERLKQQQIEEERLREQQRQHEMELMREAEKVRELERLRESERTRESQRQREPENSQYSRNGFQKRQPALELSENSATEKFDSISDNSSPEARFEKLYNQEKGILSSKTVLNVDSEDNDLEFEEKIRNFEKISSGEKKQSAFNYSEEVEDLSEKSHYDGTDNTGYYERVNTGGKIDFNPSPNTKPVAEVPAYHSPKQINIGDYAASAPVEVKPKKKKQVKYIPPDLDLLLTIAQSIPDDYNTVCEEKARLLEDTLKGLKLPAKVNGITRGPAVTRYELDMPPGIPVKRIEQFAPDIEYYLASNGKIRIETPIPGKRAVGIEVPNEKIDIVGLKEIISSKEFQSSTSPLTLALGKDIAGSSIICHLDKMPHLLIAGATGSGKSACLNSIIISILYKSSPDDVRLILVDPKHVEFTVYKGLPHLLTEEIITDTQQAINTLKWLRAEMERRYLLFGKYMVRNLQEFNKSDVVKDGTEEKVPYIVLIVDELAELMMANNRKELEDKIMSMAQKARAAGIHLILATQRPSVDVITGTIKANLPSRIAFSVKSMVDSRTILDQAGAETLLGRGDMLYAPLGFDDPKRVQGAYVTNEEVTTIASFVRENNQAEFDDDIKSAIAVREESTEIDAEEEEKEFDDIMPDVLKCVIESGSASTSMIQRRFSVGYARASRIIDQMELHKFIGPLDGSKPRAVYISREQYKEIFGRDI